MYRGTCLVSIDSTVDIRSSIVDSAMLNSSSDTCNGIMSRLGCGITEVNTVKVVSEAAENISSAHIRL